MSRLQITIIFLFFVFSLSSICYGQPIASTELINNAKQYDGKAIVYAGEVVGEVMPRGEYAWANIYDGANAIGIWLPKSLAAEIAYTGTYKSKGDMIEIAGIFRRACIEHGGDLDIHAFSIRKIMPGRTLGHRLNTGKRNLSLGLLGALIIIWISRQLKRK